MRRHTLSRAQVNRGALILVNGGRPLEASAPEGLTAVDPAHGDVLLTREAAERLSACIRRVGGESGIVPVSGWRGREEQQRIWDDSLAEHGLKFTRQYVARPGCSEHQTGLAIDLAEARPEIDFLCPDFPDTGVCGAFRAQAAEYGFVERYPAGKEAVTGISHEPWHFRYVGVPHAGIMAERGLVLEEYHELLKELARTGERLCWRCGEKEYEIFYRGARQEGEMELDLDGEGPYSVSGDNGSGFIVTLERKRRE